MAHALFPANDADLKRYNADPPGEDKVMFASSRKIARTVVACCALLLATDALAFRCGNRLIKEGMPEARVIDLCGEPVSTRHLGYVLRPYIIKRPAGNSVRGGMRHVYGGFHEELMVTEMLFNFGPRKLMRRVRFEGGLLVSIETAGYGHISEKK